MFEIQGPVTKFGNVILDNLTSNFTDFVANYITVFPILLGVTFGVWSFLQMINKPLAKTGGILVFVYGALILIA